MDTADKERFLRRFHARQPGATWKAFARGRCADGRSSYEWLADRAPAAGRVLDLGCGDGFLLEQLRDRGVDAARLIGADLSEGELAAARARPALDGVGLVQARAQALPFTGAQFQGCVSHMAFMLMSDVDAVAAEVARVLVPGATFATVVGGGPAANVDDGFVRFLSVLVPLVDATGRTLPRLGDRRTRTREGLDEILGPAGFGPASAIDLAVDLGGDQDTVWSTLSTVYEIELLDDAGVIALRDGFYAETRGLLDADGRMACIMKVVLGAATRS